MPNVDLQSPATVVIIPPRPGAGPSPTARRDITLASAIRFVVEQLSATERPRAVVRTPTRSLFIEEIQALYDLSRVARHPAASSGRR
jgi:hypothetical protein